MGQNGDWKKEGYKIMHSPLDRKAAHPSDNGYADPSDKFGFRISAIKDGVEVGFALVSWSHEHKGISSHETKIHPEHRRKGLATALYQYAEQLSGKRMYPHHSQTSEANELWAQPDRPFGRR